MFNYPNIIKHTNKILNDIIMRGSILKKFNKIYQENQNA